MGVKTRRELLASGAGLGASSALFGPHLAAASAKSAGSELGARRRDLRALESLMSAERR